jgi:putative endonuclease
MSTAFVYMLRCSDNSLYIGSTTDVVRRLEEHQRGKGARYTRGRGPLEVVLVVSTATLSAARSQEAFWQQLRRADRLALVASLGQPPWG